MEALTVTAAKLPVNPTWLGFTSCPTPIRKWKEWAAATRLLFCQLEHRLGERDQGTLEPRGRKERWKAPHVTWHEKERLQEGHSKEARQSGIKRYILLFTCQRPADTKTKQKQRRCPGSLSWKELLIGQHNLGANHSHARPPNLPTPAVPFKAGFSG